MSLLLVLSNMDFKLNLEVRIFVYIWHFKHLGNFLIKFAM